MKSLAKVNLTLEVVSKRADGYHNIESVFALVKDLYDQMEIQETRDEKISINIEYSTDWQGEKNIPTDKTNSVYRVLDFLRQKHNINSGFIVSIFKEIPTGAGLGGGSSNAAVAAKWFAKKYGVQLDLNELSKIGADIPFFVIGKLACVQGIGELVTPLKNDISLNATLVKPPFGSCTKTAYQNVNVCQSKYTSRMLQAIAKQDVEKIIENTYNSFNILKDVENKISQCGFSKVVMSGSGSTFICFGNGNKDKLIKENYWIKKVQIG